MSVVFPSNPNIGDEVSGGGFTWTWNGVSWSKVAAAGSTSGEDFLLDVGSSGNTTFTFDSDMAAGQYSIASQANDPSLEIYLVASDDTSAGFTTSSSITATKPFNRIVVYGTTNNDAISFTYKKAVSPTGSGNVGGGVPPFITSIATSSLPNQGDTTVVTGGNFAPNVQVTFIDKNGATYSAQSVTRTSSTSLIAARPANMLTSNAPYSVRVSNPGFSNSALRAHTLSNAVTVGNGPSWSTDATLPIYSLNSAYSTTVAATDPEGSAIVYSIASGSLPTGLSLNSSTGVISGTPAADAASTSITLRATDAGGNFSDRVFKLAKTITVTGGTLYTDSTYSYRKFTGTSPLYVGGGTLTYDALLVGGGGNGGGSGGEEREYNSWSRAGGGGGGGGVIQVNSKTLGIGTHSVIVGGDTKIGTSSTDIAYAGGNGGEGSQPSSGGNGASGGGAGVMYASWTNPTTRQGTPGVSIYPGQGTNGTNAQGSSLGGNGGGLATTAYNTNWTSKVAGPTTLGAGGTGGNSSNAAAWQGTTGVGSQGAGGANSGAGGGGSTNQNYEYYGGPGAQAGLVIIRYLKSLAGE